MRNLTYTVIITLFTIVSGYGQSSVCFTVEDLPNITNQRVGIRGNLAPLDWSKSIALKRNGNSYMIDLDFPASEKELEFKFVLFEDDKEPTWESIPNRTLSLQGNQTNQISNNKWNLEQIIDLNTLDKIVVEGLKKDFELIETMVLNVHPGTYRYNSKEEILNALEELKNKFSRPIKHQEAYLAISKLTAFLKCDHTKAGFNNQSKIVNSIIHYQKDKVPFTFRWVNEQMIVTHNASENKLLRRGTVIKNINGVAVEEIKKELLLYTGADGATDNNRSYKLEVDGYDFRYNAFDIFFPLLFPLAKSAISLEIQGDDSNDILDLEVALLTREDRTNILIDRYENFPRSRDDLWRFQVMDDSIGVLTINSFGLNGWKAMTLDYKQFLAETFENIATKEVQHLIIDIRENNGGADEMATELFSYIAEESYNFKREGRTRYLSFPETLKPYIQTWGDDPWYYNLNSDNEEPIDGYYLFKDHFQQDLISDKTIFNGKLYLLISSANTSLAFYTAYKFKQQQLGLTIGQETGGNLRGINGGQILFLRLPNSQIEIDFPIMGGFALEPQADMGVKPDVEVKVKREDILKNRDVGMETVLEIIHN